MVDNWECAVGIIFEFMMAGATAVSVGAANFFDPYSTEKVIAGIEEYMTKYGVEDINVLIGAVI